MEAKNEFENYKVSLKLIKVFVNIKVYYTGHVSVGLCSNVHIKGDGSLVLLVTMMSCLHTYCCHYHLSCDATQRCR